MSENMRKGIAKPRRQVMREVGYSPSYSDSGTPPTTESWDELMGRVLPDSLLIKHHEKLLNAKQIEYFVFPKSMDDSEITEKVEAAGLSVVVIRDSEKGKMAFYSLDNAKAKKDALDMAYKLKTRYDNTVTIKGKLNILSDREVEDAIAGEVSEALGIIAGEGSENQE